MNPNAPLIFDLFFNEKDGLLGSEKIMNIRL